MDAAAFSVSPLPELRLFSTLPDRSVSTFHRHKLADTEFHWSHPPFSLSPSVFLIDPRPQFTLGKIEEKGRGRGDARVEGRYSSRVFRFVGRKGVVHGSVNFIGPAKWFPSKCWVFEREDYRPRVSIVIQRCSLLAGREERFEKKGRCIESLEKIFLYPIPFPKKRKKEKSRISLFLPYSIPLIDQRSARPIIIKTAPLLPSLRDARAAKRRHAAKGKLFSSGKLQTGGRGANCVHANPAGWKLPGGYDTYLPGNLSSRSAIIAREIHLSWFIAPVDKYVRVNPSSWLRFFFSPLPDPNAIRPLYNAAFNSSEISSFFSSRHFKYR